MIDEKELPEGWTTSKVSSLGTLLRGVNYKKDEAIDNFKEGYTPILRGNNIQGQLNFNDLVYVLNKNISEVQRIKANDILFAMSSGSKHLVGKSAKAKKDFEGAFGAFCGVFRPNGSVDENLIAYFFQSPYYKKYISDISKGTNINNLKREHILDLDFPLPPTDEQRPIVEKIEELFSEIDKGIENLKTAQQQLKVYRQAVLKWAFEGKLTNENSKECELPKGWEWKELGDIVDRVFDGPFGSNLKSEDYVDRGIRIIRLENIGVLEFKDEYKTYVSKAKYTSLKKHTVVAGDIIFSSFVIEKVRAAILPSYIECAINKADCFCVRINHKEIDNKFLSYFLCTKNFYNQLIDQVHGATRPRINTKQLKSCLIPTCTLKKQQKVVQEIESRLSVCDNIEETINNSLQQAEALRQSILKKAFEGKLVKAKVQSLYKPKNTYFYQMQLLGIVAAASKDKGINHGEMTIAKYAYLIDKVYRIPTYYDYKRWHLGPYPPEIKKAINNAKFFTKKNSAIEVIDIGTLTKYANPYSDQLNNAVDDLSDIFSAYTEKERSHQIELLATVCKVIEDIQTTDLKAVRASMTEWMIDLPTTHFKNKAEKFSEEETEKCLKLILAKGWATKLVDK